MTPAQVNELFRTIKALRKEIAELRDLVSPIAPAKDEILNVRQAADFIGCTERHVYRLVSNGMIPYAKKGSRLKFSKNSLVQWLNQN